jgi:apolipoprotein N-acyltransferase
MTLILIISTAALSFAFAPFPLRFLAYFAVIPLLFVINKYSYKKVFWCGLLFGAAFALFHLWWLYSLVIPIEPTTKILLYLGVTILFFYLGLYAAVFSVVTKYLGVAFAPLVWAVMEFIRTKSEIGFPWGFLGYTQTPYVPIVQLASIFGIYGLSAWVLWINVVIYWILTKRHRLTYLIILIISFALPIGYGRMRMKELPTTFKVGIVQPNVGPNEKGDHQNRTRLVSELLGLIGRAIQAKPDLIILPETATLSDITRNEALRDTIQRMVDSNNVYLFTGTQLYTPGSSIYYNGAVLFKPGQIGFSEIYRKIHLVPFSEKIPYADKVSLFRKIETGDMGDCTPGKEYTIFTILNSKFQVQKFGCLICFESILPDLTRGFTKRDADMLINITNDGWFGKTPGPYQHCELAILRSVENGVPLVRCANNGISLIADPYARIKSRTKLLTQAVVIDSVPSPLKPTFYRRYGDVFIYFAIGIIGAGIIIKPLRKIRHWMS